MPDAKAPDHDESRTRITQLIASAHQGFKDGDPQLCLSLCREALAENDVPLNDAVSISLLLRSIGEEASADQVSQSILIGVRANIDGAWNSSDNLLLMASILEQVGDTAEVERLLRRAHEIGNIVTQPAIVLAVFLANTDRVDEALSVLEPAIRHSKAPVNLMQYFATILAHREAPEPAIALMLRARPLCKSGPERAKVDHMLSGIKGSDAALDQHGMAVELFDSFANTYDEQLNDLGNNGPTVMLNLLERLGLPRTPTRRILDAGCGTGLCAPFLRDWAEVLHGIDLSVGMLEKCRAKGRYDFLARTDISALHTFPEGPFDMVVCGDVLVYFGALDGVFTNFRKVLRPGGWLLFTVEEATDPEKAAGHHIYGSGRHRHGARYLERVLTDCGFSKPKHVLRDRLRFELGTPVMGLAMAAQKPALIGA